MNYGLISGQLLLLAVIVVFVGLFLQAAGRLYLLLAQGQPVARFDQPLVRTKGWLLHVLAQGRMLTRPYPGGMHAMIFWGFLIITLSTIEQFGRGLWPDFRLPLLSGSGAFKLLLDTFYLLVLVGVGMAFYRRIAVKPWYLNLSGDAVIILSLIALLIISALVAEASLGVAYPFDRDPGAYAGNALAALLSPLGTNPNLLLHVGAWWVHIITVLGFLAYLPHSKHMHIVTAPFNVWFRPLEPKGRLPYLNVEEAIEQEQPLGISQLEHLTWKDRLDTYTCTECGRCTSVCPASISGKPLSPKDLILDLRDVLLERHGHHLDGRRLVGDVITDEVLWDCTTCGACMEVCPVFIEHVPKIVNMRRHLAMEESRFGRDVQNLFENLESAGNPWKFPKAQRAQWAAGMDVPTLEEAPDVEVLYWVGCSASYDQRAQKVAQSFARLMKKAGIPFAILGANETCTGDPARRAGNEYLYQMLAQENIATLDVSKEAGIKTIVTTCPHCFNTISNEYPVFGGNFQVMHHSQFLAKLVEEGKLSPATITPSPLAGEGGGEGDADLTHKEAIAYHDPCYLGRYNQTYEEPRSILTAIPGVELREIDPCRGKSMCCGAGGARAFMDETRGRRINHIRLEQALGSNPDRIATACPYCLMMFEDATGAKGISDTLPVQDVAELLEGSLERERDPGGGKSNGATQ